MPFLFVPSCLGGSNGFNEKGTKAQRELDKLERGAWLRPAIEWGNGLTVDEAQKLLLFDTYEEQGAFVQLRLGNDPGQDRVTRLRLALRILWRHWKSRRNIPYDIAYAAAAILHFRDEALQNLRGSNQHLRERLLSVELPDLEQGAFDLLAGPIAEQWIVKRRDLGE